MPCVTGIGIMLLAILLCLAAMWADAGPFVTLIVSFVPAISGALMSMGACVEMQFLEKKYKKSRSSLWWNVTAGSPDVATAGLDDMDRGHSRSPRMFESGNACDWNACAKGHLC